MSVLSDRRCWPGLSRPAVRIVPELRSETETEPRHDSSTNALMRRYRAMR